VKHGKKEQPTVDIIDAQSVKPTLVSSQDKGFDAGKRVKGHKKAHHSEHPWTATGSCGAGSIGTGLGNPGNQQNARELEPDHKNICRRWLSGPIDGEGKTQFKIEPKIIKRNELHTFKILPKRWIVERTFAWIDTNRRNSKNYERLNNTAVAMVHPSEIRMMLNRF
jgi:Transposase DDE domain